jgi:hypothetical protein
LSNSKKLVKKNEFLSIWDLMCFKELIFDKKKRTFFEIASKNIEEKLSFEYLLFHYTTFEKIKLILLSNEQLESLNFRPKFNFENHFIEVFKNKSNIQI